MAKVKLALFFFLLLFIPFLSAQPPLETNIILTKGLQVEVPIFSIHTLGQDLHVDAHVHNASTGVLVDNSTVSCVYHIYNQTGNHVIENRNMIYSEFGKDFEAQIGAGNFTRGEYALLINCQDDGEWGGFIEFGFDINPAGAHLLLPQAILYIGFIFIFFFFFIMLIYIANRLPEEHEQQVDGEFISRSWLKYLHSVFVFVGWMLILGLFFASGSLALGFLNETVIGNMLYTVFKVMMGLTYPIVAVWFIWILVSILKDKKLKRMMSKGLYNSQQSL